MNFKNIIAIAEHFRKGVFIFIVLVCASLFWLNNCQMKSDVQDGISVAHEKTVFECFLGFTYNENTKRCEKNL